MAPLKRPVAGPVFTLGALPRTAHETSFRVWAPHAASLDLRLLGSGRRRDRVIPLRRTETGYHEADVPNAPVGTRYFYLLPNKALRPDPASRLQPEGVMGPSEVVPCSIRKRLPYKPNSPPGGRVLYEIHVGTFTPEGTFDAAAKKVKGLRDLGITHVQIMPVAAFPGERGWGYDGVFPFAVHAPYGGPEGLTRFVNACHRAGLGVILDVVYNHLGPEGCFLREFGPYFTRKFHTPWGEALNFDGPLSDETRRFFIESALYFFAVVGVDGFRLDAVNAIFDTSALPFVEQLSNALSSAAGALDRELVLIAESDANDPRVLSTTDAMYADDFQRALHASLTGERHGYFADFGSGEALARAFTHAVVLDGRKSVYYRRSHGRPVEGQQASSMIVCSQNHDPVGNRPGGDRMLSLVGFEKAKIAATATLLSPFTPLLFMGEELAETAPFFFFTDFESAALARDVREGRRREHEAFGASGVAPDPADRATFLASKLTRPHERGPRDAAGRRARAMRALYEALLRLRAEIPALSAQGAIPAAAGSVAEEGQSVVVCRAAGENVAVIAFGMTETATHATIAVPAGKYRLHLDTAEARFGGPGDPRASLPIRVSEGKHDRWPIAPASATVWIRAPEDRI